MNMTKTQRRIAQSIADAADKEGLSVSGEIGVELRVSRAGHPTALAVKASPNPYRAKAVILNEGDGKAEAVRLLEATSGEEEALSVLRMAKLVTRGVC